MATNGLDTPPVVSPEQWPSARDALLRKEKAAPGDAIVCSTREMHGDTTIVVVLEYIHHGCASTIQTPRRVAADFSQCQRLQPAGDRTCRHRRRLHLPVLRPTRWRRRLRRRRRFVGRATPSNRISQLRSRLAQRYFSSGARPAATSTGTCRSAYAQTRPATPRVHRLHPQSRGSCTNWHRRSHAQFRYPPRPSTQTSTTGTTWRGRGTCRVQGSVVGPDAAADHRQQVVELSSLRHDG